VRIHARLFAGFLTDNWWRSDSPRTVATCVDQPRPVATKTDYSAALAPPCQRHRDGCGLGSRAINKAAYNADGDLSCEPTRRAAIQGYRRAIGVMEARRNLMTSQCARNHTPLTERGFSPVTIQFLQQPGQFVKGEPRRGRSRSDRTSHAAAASRASFM
jgi:hypothetical protein